MKVVFLDRDGVINKDKGYVSKIEDFEFIDGVFSACKHALNRGFELFIITNQSGIGRGYYKEADFKVLNQWMLQKFKEHHINILEVLYCPHAPEDDCMCRKPKTGMFDEISRKYQIDKDSSWMIGDKESDIKAALKFGITNTILIQSSQHTNSKNSAANYIIHSIIEASNLIS